MFDKLSDIVRKFEGVHEIFVRFVIVEIERVRILEHACDDNIVMKENVRNVFEVLRRWSKLDAALDLRILAGVPIKKKRLAF